MRTAYHYTTEKTYKRIKADGALKPKSPLLCRGIELHGFVLPAELYTFAFLDTPEPETWKNAGLIDRLKLKLRAHAAGEINFFRSFVRTPFNYVILSFPIEDPDSVVVLDALSLMNNGKETPAEAKWRYLSTAVRLSEYKEEYEGPELAIGYEIPIKKISLERVVGAKTLGLF